MLRLSEGDTASLAGSSAVLELGSYITRALWQASLGFSQGGNSLAITPMLGKFLEEEGYRDIHIVPHVIDFSFGSAAYESVTQNFLTSYQLMQPFLTRMGVLTHAQFAELYQMAQMEMRSQNFRGLWYFLTASGKKTPQNQKRKKGKRCISAIRERALYPRSLAQLFSEAYLLRFAVEVFPLTDAT